MSEHESVSIRPPTRRERVQITVKKLVQSKSGIIGIILLLPVFFTAIFAPQIAPHDVAENNYDARFVDPGSEYLLGTDKFGRDLLSRTLVGSRSSLLMGLGSVALALALGVPIGLLAGYSGGRTDEFVMRSMDVLMTFPTILLALLLMTVLTPSIWAAIFAVGVAYGPKIARVTRASTLSVKNEEFVQAAEQRGESTVHIMFQEILPNIRGPIVVESTIRIGYAIMTGAALSFLGLGVQPPTPDWGFMIAAARDNLYNSIWFLLWPSVALAVTVLGFNLLGDGLSDVYETEVDQL
jgi:peptide/nickel transport system permease protein